MFLIFVDFLSIMRKEGQLEAKRKADLAVCFIFSLLYIYKVQMQDELG